MFIALFVAAVHAEVTVITDIETVKSDTDWKVWCVHFLEADSAESEAAAAVTSKLAEKAGDILKFGSVDTATEDGAALATAQGWVKGDADTLLKVYAWKKEDGTSRAGLAVSSGVVSQDIKIGELYKELNSHVSDEFVSTITGQEHLQQFFQITNLVSRRCSSSLRRARPRRSTMR